jgi:hypothetical protein
MIRDNMRVHLERMHASILSPTHTYSAFDDANIVTCKSNNPERFCERDCSPASRLFSATRLSCKDSRDHVHRIRRAFALSLFLSHNVRVWVHEHAAFVSCCEHVAFGNCKRTHSLSRDHVSNNFFPCENACAPPISLSNLALIHTRARWLSTQRCAAAFCDGVRVQSVLGATPNAPCVCDRT